MSDQHSHFTALNGDIMPDGTPAPVVHRTNEDARVRVSEPMAPYPAHDQLFDFTDEDDEVVPDQGSSLSRRRVIIGVAALLVLVIVGIVIVNATHAAKVPLRYTTTAVVRDNLTVTTATTGQISSGVYNLNFPTGGKIAEIDVTSGQNVKAGQILAKLDPTTLQDSLSSAQSGFNSAQVSLNNAYTNQADSDALAYDNYNQAIASGKVDAKTAKDQLNQALAQAQAQVTSSQAQYRNAQIQLTTAQHNLANATLTAPIDGQIAAINGLAGATASSSGTSGLIVLVNLATLTIAGQVNEADIGNVQVGQPASFTVQAFPADTFFGTVAAISPIGVTTQNVVTYPVTVNIDAASAKQARLFPGMTAQVTITTKQIIDALLIPNTALSYARTAVRSGHITTAQAQQAILQAQQLMTNATDTSVKQGQASYVLEMSNGKVIAVPVVTGFTNGTDTVILAGLNENDGILSGDNQATTTTTTNTAGQRTRNGGGGGLFGGGR